MPENNQSQYELDHDYAPIGIVDASDGSGTTWPEFVGQVNKMDNQVAALTEDRDSRSQAVPIQLGSGWGMTGDVVEHDGVVTLAANFYKTSNFTSGETVFTVSDEFLPRDGSNVAFVAFIANTESVGRFFIENATGKASIITEATGKRTSLDVNGSWII